MNWRLWIASVGIVIMLFLSFYLIIHVVTEKDIQSLTQIGGFIFSAIGMLYLSIGLAFLWVDQIQKS